MANVNRPLGLKPMRKLGGGCVVTNAYSIASEYGTSIYTGDPVMMTGTGKDIEIAPAGTVNAIGVFVGCKYVAANGDIKISNYWPASTALLSGTTCEALVIDDPNVIFEMQADTAAAADIGALCDWVAGTGSLVTGNSAYTAEGSSTATTGKSLRILGLSQEIGNDYGAYAKLEVMFAEHALKGVVAGVGGD